MNWLDVLLIIVLCVISMGAIIIQIIAIKDEEKGVIGGVFCVWLMLFLIIMGTAFFRADLKSGSTIGTITSVDRNFFGQSYSIYIKTTETTEEKYCTESDEITWKARDLIGKKVKITYGTRVGLYSTGQCDDAPIDILEEVIE